MRIDAHAHLYPERFLNLIEAQGEKYPIQIVRPGPGEDRKLIIGGNEFFSFAPDFFDVDVRLSEMAESNVDMQVLSLAPPMVYWGTNRACSGPGVRWRVRLGGRAGLWDPRADRETCRC